MTAPSNTLSAIMKSVSDYCAEHSDYKVVIACPAEEQDKARALMQTLSGTLPVRPATYVLSMPTSESLKALLSLKESALALVAHDFPDRLLRYARVHHSATRERIALLAVCLSGKGRAPDLMLYRDDVDGRSCLSASPFDPSAPTMQILHQDFSSASRHNGASH